MLYSVANLVVKRTMKRTTPSRNSPTPARSLDFDDDDDALLPFFLSKQTLRDHRALSRSGRLFLRFAIQLLSPI